MPSPAACDQVAAAKHASRLHGGWPHSAKAIGVRTGWSVFAGAVEHQEELRRTRLHAARRHHEELAFLAQELTVYQIGAALLICSTVLVELYWPRNRPKIATQ